MTQCSTLVKVQCSIMTCTCARLRFQNEGWEDEEGDGDGGGVLTSDFNLEDYADLSDEESDPDAVLDPVNSINLQVRGQPP